MTTSSDRIFIGMDSVPSNEPLSPDVTIEVQEETMAATQ